MDQERFETIDRLYHDALNVDPQYRAGFLKDACGGDESLQRAIESLLTLNQQAEGFIDRPAIEVVAAVLGREMADRTPRLSIQRRLRPSELIADRFEIVDLIGSGGMGDVYEARDLHLGDRVALKTIRPEFTSDELVVGRFKREILLAKRVTHPNVCRIYDVGFHVGEQNDKGASGELRSSPMLFLTMELLRGENLSDRLRRGRMTPGEALPLVEQIAAGLDAAHRVGVVHRDFKAPNVMLVPSEGGPARAVITDFGLARRLHRSDDVTSLLLTEPGQIAGTPDYMSPEQVLGKEVTFAADIYALGIVMYEMLTGTRPFHAETPIAAAAKRLLERPVPPSKYVDNLDPAWEAVILRCLERDPSDRFASATDVARALGGLEPLRPVKRTLVKRRLMLLAGFGAAASVGSIGFRRLFRSDPAPSIAVLPFRNDDPALDHISEGMTEDLINALGQREGLRVMSRAAVYGQKETDVAPQELGRKMNARFLLTGRLLRKGDELSIAVELTSTDDGVHIWGQQYQHRLSGIVTVEEDIAHEVLKNLNLKFGPEEQRRFASRRAVDPEVNELYWRARFFWNKRTQEGFEKAIEYFSAAIEKDPRFALAYTGLADCYAMRSGVLPPNEVFPRAKAAARKALELDDTLAEAHASLAFTHLFFDWDWLRTEKEYRRAIQLNPNYPTAHSMYGMYLVAMKRFDEALSEMKRALELDPSSVAINTGVGRVLFYARKYPQAAAEYLKTLEMDPDFAQALFDLGRTRAATGRYDEAIALLERGLKSGGEDASAIADIAYVHRKAGQQEAAEQTVKSLGNLSARRYVSPYFLAVAQLIANDERALDLLEQAWRDRSFSMIYLDVDHRFDRLRSHPRYRSLLRRLGFRAH